MNDRLAGILLGTGVGDALGLPAEGLSPARRQRLLPGPWRHRLLFGRGMVSDDTEHTLFVADRLADQLRRGHPLGEVSYPWPAVLPRNLFFLLLVLLHAFRRLAPPY